MTMAGTSDNKKVSLFLCGLSSVQCETVGGLVAPETPRDVAFDDLTAKLKVIMVQPEILEWKGPSFALLREGRTSQS